MRSLLRLVSIIASVAMLGVPLSGTALAAGPESVADLAGRLSPAVVNIGTSRRVPGNQGMPFPDVPEGSPLEEFFDELNPNNGQGQDQMMEARSLGSGFIISADGLVVTNNHVIEGATEILVFLTDGRRLTATLVGADDKMDLAILKVDAGSELPFVSFGNSDDANVGDWVMAIGNPFGLGGSVTLGIVSARNRDISSGPYDNFIQTDAAINQGNSGGPLFDMDGNVVGINTAIIARGGSALGIGFAVPSNLAEPVLQQLAEFGETRRGWLGVGIQDLTEDLALALDRPNINGALVVNVTPGGPSDGVLEDGDLILEFDEQIVLRMRDLPRIVAQTPVGQMSTVKVLRGGEEFVFDITLGRLEDGERMVAGLEAPVPLELQPEAPAEPIPTPQTLSDLIGFEAGELTEEARAEFGIVPTLDGVIITDVRLGSDAEEKGLISGLIVQEVNQRAVASVDELTDLIAEAREAGRPAVLFKIADATGNSRFVAVRPE